MNVNIDGRSRLVSVIVPCFNRLEFTQRCIAALVRHTRTPWELIVIDDGSTDGTSYYFAGVEDSAPFRVDVITNSENRGFPVACNQGLRVARGDYLALLHNDTVVTDAWLNQLVALADSKSEIGITGPMSNHAMPLQVIARTNYENLEAMQDFAIRWRVEHRGQWFSVKQLSGFCMLMKRRTLQALCGLDEGFGLGPFDDDSLAMRVRRAGFELAVAGDLFVHHVGGEASVGGGAERKASLKETHERFTAKWGDDKAGQQRITPGFRSLASISPSAKHRPAVSLAMIVRDEERNLGGCLESVIDLFEEIVVVDTGSTDRTVEVAKSFGARVFEFPWSDDFSAARNAALDHCTGSHSFWLDADDRVEASECGKLRTLFDQLTSDASDAYVLRCFCDADCEGKGPTVVDHIRLFPLRSEIRWIHRVHEQILPALRRANVKVRKSEITIRHIGYIDSKHRLRKLDRDLRLLEMELHDRPNDPFVLFNLGWSEMNRGDSRRALEYLEASLKLSVSDAEIARKLYVLIAQAQQKSGMIEDALASCAAGLAIATGDSELLFRQGIIRRIAGDRKGAESSWTEILVGSKSVPRFSSIVAGISSHLPRRNLAVLAEEQGNRDRSEQLWRQVLEECPGDREATAQLQRLTESELPATSCPPSAQALHQGTRSFHFPVRSFEPLDLLPDFDSEGFLPPGDYVLTFDQLVNSILVNGPPGCTNWDRIWRSRLISNLRILAEQLAQVGIQELYIGGSFVTAKDHPNDIDGYFECEEDIILSGELIQRLNLLDPHKVWTWDDHRRWRHPGKGKKLPMWHQYRVELFPHYGQVTTGFHDHLGVDVDYPELFRRTKVLESGGGAAYCGGRIHGVIKLVGTR